MMFGAMGYVVDLVGHCTLTWLETVQWLFDARLWDVGFTDSQWLTASTRIHVGRVPTCEDLNSTLNV